jgi:hypothetical protein
VHVTFKVKAIREKGCLSSPCKESRLGVDHRDGIIDTPYHV